MTVCGTVSLFVQVTVVPCLIVSVEGLNEKFCILTVAVEGETDVVVVVVEEVVTVEVSGVVDTTDGVCSGTVLEPFWASKKYAPPPTTSTAMITAIVLFKLCCFY